LKDFRAFANKVDWSKTLDDSAKLSALFQIGVVKIVGKYGPMAAAMACDFYDEARATAGAKGYFRAEAQPPPPAAGIEAQVRFAARWLFGADPQPSKMLDFLEGEVDKKVKAAYRDTITESARLDPAKPEVRRMPHGTCEFCKLVADRDYQMARRGADRSHVNEYHPNCNCVPVAVWFNDGKKTGVLSGRFSQLQEVKDALANVTQKAEIVSAMPGSIRALDPPPPGFELLKQFLANPSDPWSNFQTPWEQATAAKLRHSFGIELTSIERPWVLVDGRKVFITGPDAIFTGTEVPVELKYVLPKPSAKKDGQFTSAIHNQIRNGRRQARNIIIDGQDAGVTASDARQAILDEVRQFGDDLDSIIILLGNNTIGWTHA
jgi:uncharacterized protein YfcZ (UPF0381/DUF406 family)